MPKFILLICSIFSYYIFPIALAEELGDEFPSSSKNWKLTHNRRRLLRQHGYCVHLCGFGYDATADAYDNYMTHFRNTKHKGYFRELTEFIDMSEVEGDLTNRLGEIDVIVNDTVDEDEQTRTLETLSKLIDEYCLVAQVGFDDCLTLKRDAVTMDHGEKCLMQCLEVMPRRKYPSLEEVSPDTRDFEKCLDSFRGPAEVFDFLDTENTTLEALLASFDRNGFLMIENFFDKDLMENVTKVMNTWDVDGIWNNFTFSDFYSSYPGQLSEYKHRREIVLPYVEPFSTVLSIVHNSIIMNLLKAYGGNERPIDLDFPASIMSYPGATQQETHGDHGFSRSMIKVGIAIHDVTELNGPTQFCPCSHANGMFHPVYNLECGIRYHPSFISAGSVIIYDMSVKHRGSANRGNLRRYLLDLSYSAGHYFNGYQETYPKLAQEYVLMYREKFKNL